MKFERGHKKKAGRPKGVPNKSTLDIKTLIWESVDFRELNEKMGELAKSGNVQAARLLYEYGFGKPTQTINATINSPDREESRRAFAEIFGRRSELSISPSGELVSRPEPVQDSEQGKTDGLLDRDRSGGNGKDGVPG